MERFFWILWGVGVPSVIERVLQNGELFLPAQRGAIDMVLSPFMPSDVAVACLLSPSSLNPLHTLVLFCWFCRISSRTPRDSAVVPNMSEERLANAGDLGVCSLGYGALCFMSFLKEQSASLYFQSLENGFGPQFISKVPGTPWGNSVISTTLHLSFTSSWS